MAGFNYGYERNKMEQEFAQIAAVCRAEGIPEDTIELIHRTMLDELNSNRRFQTHAQSSYDSLRFPNEGNTSVDKNPLVDKYLESFSAVQVEIWEWAGWIEDLDTPEIIMWVQGLNELDRRLLTLLAMDGLKQTEVAKILKKQDSAISRKMKNFRESLTKVLPERLRKLYIK